MFWTLINILFNITFIFLLVIIICDYITDRFGDGIHNLDMSSNNKEVTKSVNMIPEYYVDENILKSAEIDFLKNNHRKVNSTRCFYDKAYEINGTIFHENVTNDTEMLSEFEIKAMDKLSMSSVLETPYGVLVNNTVLLTVNQWNTVVDYNDTNKCIVCDTIVDDTNVNDHVGIDMHIRNLKKHQPLKKFDLTITRMIKDTYHCGVCNECFNMSQREEHFDGKSHEGNMLTATNRAFDVMIDLGLADDMCHGNSDNGNFDNGNMNNDNSDEDENMIQLCINYSSDSETGNRDDFYENSDASIIFGDIDFYNGNFINERNEFNEQNTSYASIAKKCSGAPDYLCVNIFNKDIKIKYDHWHMIIVLKNNKLYCMVCKTFVNTSKVRHCDEKSHLDKLKSFQFDPSYPDCYIRRISEQHYHCGLCNNLQLIPDISEHIDSKHKKKVMKNIFSKEDTKINTASRIENNDNVINDTRIKNNESIPMEYTHATGVIDEMSATKDTINSNVTVTGAIRYKDNGTEVIDCKEEINATNTHPRNNEITVTEGTIPKNNEIITTETDSKSEEITATGDSRAINNDTGHNNEIRYEINNETPDVYNDVVINQYGFKIRISFISYNLVSRRQNDYYCHICEMAAFDKDMSCHIKDPCHVKRLRNIPFQNIFTFNLIRMIGYMNHCAICNMILYIKDTKTHLFEKTHVDLLIKACAYTFNPDSNHPAMYQLAIGMNPSAIESNHPAMHQPKIDTNPPAIDLNQRAMFTHPIGMNPPTIESNQRGIPAVSWNPRPILYQPVFMNIPQISHQGTPQIFHAPRFTGMAQLPPQPILNTHQWPLLKKITNHTLNMNPTTTLPTNDKNGLNQSKKEQKEIELQENSKLSKIEEKAESEKDLNHLQIESNPTATATKSKLESIDDLNKESFDKTETKESTDDLDNESFDNGDDLEYFNDKFVYLKHKNTFIQVDLGSYHSLVSVGDGSRYCFVCSKHLYGSLKAHIFSLEHRQSMNECKFVEKYDKHLLRQNRLNYHCSICNVVFTKKYIETHIAWPLHTKDNKIDNKTRRKKLKSGSKTLNVQFKKETTHNEDEMGDIKIIKIEIESNMKNIDIIKKNKLIVFRDQVFKISWDAYHGLVKQKGALRCALCACDVRSYKVSSHVAEERHSQSLDKFLTQHLPHLIRKVNESVLNCTICNSEVGNKEHIMNTHLKGKKHMKNYHDLLDKTSNSTLESNADVLYLS